MLHIHTPQAVFSLRHAPSWLLLTFAAGAVNAIAFFACSRFVTHVTGGASQIGMGVVALDYGVILACFISGAMTSAALINGRYARGKQPLYATTLFITAGLLSAVAALGMLGTFGAFGGEIDGPHDFAFLSMLSFAMGMQNAAVATSTGSLVRTTHMTGPATDLGVHLATAFYAKGDEFRVAVRHAALRGGKICAFIAGGIGGATVAVQFHYGAFFVPAAFVAFATVLSFVNRPISLPTRNESTT